MKTVVLSIVGIVLGLLLIANVLPDVVDETITDDYAENFNTSTGVGVTTATETLTYDHYYADLTELSASSDNEEDTPVVMAYDEDTKGVSVAGLKASDTRIMTVSYVREANQQFTGFSAFVRLTPFLCVIGLIFAGIWGLFSHFKSRG